VAPSRWLPTHVTPRGDVTLAGCGKPSSDEVGPHPTTRRDIDVNRAPSGYADGHQPRFHGPGAGMLCCQQPLVRSDARAGSRTQLSAHRHPFTDARARSPSRATGRDLYPNPIRSDTSRHETEASSGGDSDGAGRRSGQGMRLGRSHHTSPPPRRVGAREPRTRRTSATTLARGPPCTDASQGQGSHLPSFREEERDPPHPRCLPSVNPATGDPDETLSGPILDIGGRGEPYLYPGMVLSTACCQPGDNAQLSFQAHCIRSP